MRLVCLSDTHLRAQPTTLPAGDVLLHAGDATMRGRPQELCRFGEWFASQPHRHKLFVPGNHDWGFAKDPQTARALLGPDITVLIDQGVQIDGLHFWGTPWTPVFFDWAFMAGPEQLRSIFARIPTTVDVLISHGPPKGIGGRCVSGEDAGCSELRDALARVRPRLHVCGHIHEDRGDRTVDGTRYLNASMVDVGYQAVHPPWVVDLSDEGGHTERRSP